MLLVVISCLGTEVHISGGATLVMNLIPECSSAGDEEKMVSVNE